MSKRKKTYGEAMSEWERERDEADLRRRLSKALSANDTNSIKRLLAEAKNEGIDILDVCVLVEKKE